jgi:hypothetical protein
MWPSQDCLESLSRHCDRGQWRNPLPNAHIRDGRRIVCLVVRALEAGQGAGNVQEVVVALLRFRRRLHAPGLKPPADPRRPQLEEISARPARRHVRARIDGRGTVRGVEQVGDHLRAVVPDARGASDSEPPVDEALEARKAGDRPEQGQKTRFRE